MLNVIDYVPGTSILHRLNPVSKLALAAALVASTLLAGTWVGLVALLACTFIFAASAGVTSRLVTLLKVVAPIALVMLALQVMFVRTGEPVAFVATVDGLVTGGQAALRLIGIALPLALMLAVTRLTDLANACVEVLHVPYRYAFTFTTALRFVPVLMREMNAIMEAQTARGVQFDSKNPFRKLSLMLPICIPLLVSSVGKTDAAALAAEQRGFYLRTRESSYKRYPLRAIDFDALAISLALILFGIAL